MVKFVACRKLALASTAVYLAFCIPGYAQSVVDLPEVTVYGEKIARPSQETTTSVGVVTGDRIQQEQLQDVHEAINSTANALS